MGFRQQEPILSDDHCVALPRKPNALLCDAVSVTSHDARSCARPRASEECVWLGTDTRVGYGTG